MERKFTLLICGFIVLFGFVARLSAQTTTVVDSSNKTSVIVIPGKKYDRSGLHSMLWGKQWRSEWATPVRVNTLNFDTMYGGLKPIKKAGGKQTKNLRLESAAGREYAIRSVDKNYGKSIPEEYQGTFLQKMVDDQMSSSYPYAGLVIKKLSAAAGIYSTNPSLYYVSEGAHLDSFSKEYGNLLYFIEDRPGSANAKYYNAEKVEEASDLFEALQKNPYQKVDQTAYAKARLFDLMIGDWDRHFDQWVWAKKEVRGNVVYSPMPKDRDQAMASYDGMILKSITKAARLTMLQPFTDDIRSVEGYTWVYRNFDAVLTNEVSLETWVAQANELKQQMTDQVIEEAVKQVPAEVFPVSGAELISTLKARRDNLESFARAFYESLNEEPIILGSDGTDRIEVIGQSKNTLQLNMYAENNSTPYYSRTFNDEDTKEIRIYGMKGADNFSARSKTNEIIVRFIGGPDRDKYDVPSDVSKIVLYDDKENDFSSSSAKLHVTNDTMLYKFNGKPVTRDDVRIKPLLGFTNEDRIYVGLGLTANNYTFMDEPFTSKNSLTAKYSITQKAFSFGYKGLFRNVIRHIDLGLNGEYDEVRDQDFLGVGNNTVKSNTTRQYYRYRNKEANASLNIIANLSKQQTLTVAGFYQMVQLYNDPGKYISSVYIPTHTQVLDAQNFIGARAAYDLDLIKKEAVPRGGVKLHLGFDHTVNTGNKKIVNKVSALGGFILPLGAFSLSSKIGASKLWGEPEFYQLNRIGSGNTLRGYLRFRLYGNAAVYNQNELQWTFDVKSFLFNGKAGLIGLFDNGRVWVPGEVSDKWYTAVGGGIMIAPFNKISVAVTYAVSKEDSRISLRAGHLLSR